MLNWLTKTNPGRAAVYLPGTAAATAAAVAERFRAAGVTVAEKAAGTTWRLAVDHPTWGSAEVEAVPGAPDLEVAVQHAVNLSEAERAACRPPYSTCLVTVPAGKQHVLRDRKTLLRFADVVMGDTGLVAIDIVSQLPWTRAALADELAHDADLDVEALYSIHAVHGDPTPTDPGVYWMHTHGLGEVGAFDIDVVAPHPAFVQQGDDAFRAIAERALAGDVSIDGPPFMFGMPGGDARAVRAATFMRDADPKWTRLRDATDHDRDRAVLCQPASSGPLSFLRRQTLEPMAFARRSIPEQFASLMSAEFSALQADRARNTVALLRRYREEFAAIDHAALVKLGMPTPSGGREHMWFEVHDIGDDWVDATLVNQPFEVAMHEGERGRHSLDVLTDWAMFTAEGQINPRSSHVVRRLRELSAAP